MDSIEQRFVGQWPHWFEGIRGQLSRPLLHGMSRLAKIDQAQRLIAELPHVSGLEFVEEVLRRLGVRYRGSRRASVRYLRASSVAGEANQAVAA